MLRYLILLTGAALASAAIAQQQLPLTGWRAQLDAELSRVSMPREAHLMIMQILQAHERRAADEQKK